MNEHGYCPACNADLDGGNIPVESLKYYSGTKWGRQMGIEVRGTYDGVLIWRCPDCEHNWPRFPEGDRLHSKGLEIIESWRKNAQDSQG